MQLREEHSPAAQQLWPAGMAGRVAAALFILLLQVKAGVFRAQEGAHLAFTREPCVWLCALRRLSFVLSLHMVHN